MYGCTVGKNFFIHNCYIGGCPPPVETQRDLRFMNQRSTKSITIETQKAYLCKVFVNFNRQILYANIRDAHRASTGSFSSARLSFYRYPDVSLRYIPDACQRGRVFTAIVCIVARRTLETFRQTWFCCPAFTLFM